MEESGWHVDLRCWGERTGGGVGGLQDSRRARRRGVGRRPACEGRVAIGETVPISTSTCAVLGIGIWQTHRRSQMPTPRNTSTLHRHKGDRHTNAGTQSQTAAAAANRGRSRGSGSLGRADCSSSRAPSSRGCKRQRQRRHAQDRVCRVLRTPCR